MKTLYRPVGSKELELIKESGYKKFPPRLSWQPVFYPVVDFEYACTIAREWNTNDDANGNAGFVTQFEIPDEYFEKFEVQNVGLRNHNELWIPSEEMDDFNEKLIGGIKVIKAFYGDKYKGNKDEVNSIHYINGDATNPIVTGNKIIVHICNDIGGWGKGFVLAISKKWKEPEKSYKAWFKSAEDFGLGKVQFVQVEDDLWVANLIAQVGIYKDKNGNPPIRYEAVAEGLIKVTEFAIENNASIHMPRIGCGLAGGTWDKMEPIILRAFVENGIATTVYDFQ